MSYTYEYPRPMVTVDAVVFRQNENKPEVILIQRKNYPYEGMWALPGGFVDMDVRPGVVDLGSNALYPLAEQRKIKALWYDAFRIG